MAKESQLLEPGNHKNERNAGEHGECKPQHVFPLQVER